VGSIKQYITVFEHQILKKGTFLKDVEFTSTHLESLENFYGEKGVPYFSLVNKGVQFNEYVGAIQVGNLTIEVLPKADKYNNTSDWQKILIGMLKSVGAFDSHAPSSSSLKIKHNYILELYFELFIRELEYLFHQGLIKKYRRTEGNRLSLKGSLLFGKHIQYNLVHKERFYVKDSIYDKDHKIHQILYKTLNLLKRNNSSTALNSRIGNLLLNFPEQKDIQISESTFNKIIQNRKTEVYKQALDISRLLLLNYHPDLSKGQNNVLALMFDMNVLWEKFIYVGLRKKLSKDWQVTAQISRNFWKPEYGSRSTMKPDIVLKNINGVTVVLDTKWKNIGFKNPSPEDLRQMYVYHDYFEAEKVALVYPGEKSIVSGRYYSTLDGVLESECSIIKVPTDTNIGQWQENIANTINGWI